MERRTLLAMAASLTLLPGADDPWAKVRELKSGTELRIQKKGSAQPLLARMDEANEDRVVVVVKNEQMAIPREEIDRLDARAKGGGRVVKETKTVTNGPPGNPSPSEQRVGGATPGPTSSSSGSLTFGSKPDFEPVYRRPPKQ